MDEIVVHNGRNQSGGEHVVTREAFISATCCVSIKETSGADACSNCGLNVRADCGHTSKDNGDEKKRYILCFLCGLVMRIPLNVKLDLNCIWKYRSERKWNLTKKNPPGVDKGLGDTHNQ